MSICKDLILCCILQGVPEHIQRQQQQQMMAQQQYQHLMQQHYLQQQLFHQQALMMQVEVTSDTRGTRGESQNDN